MKTNIRIFVILALFLCLATLSAQGRQRSMNVNAALEELKSYQPGQSRRALNFLELEISRSTSDPELRRMFSLRLGRLLGDPDTTHAAKLFICRQLPLIGDNSHVKTLSQMLDDPQTVDMARRSLEAIPGNASLSVLRNALTGLQGRALVGAINSIGVRGDTGSIPILANMLNSADPQTAAASAIALGNIGTRPAADALARVSTNVSGEVLRAVTDGQLRCAQWFADAGNDAAAAAIYEQMYARGATGGRLAALRGMVQLNSRGAANAVMEAIQSSDPALAAEAIQLSRYLQGRRITRELTDMLSRLDASRQVLLIDALAARGDRSAYRDISQLLASRNPAVKQAVVRAMGDIGDLAAVRTVARIAATEKGALQAEARQSLARIEVIGVNGTLVNGAARGEPGLRAEYIRAMAARSHEGAAGVLLRAARDDDPQLRAAAWEAIGEVAEPDLYPQLLNMMARIDDGGEARIAADAVWRVSSRIADRRSRIDPVVGALNRAGDSAKPAFLRLLSKFGGADALAPVASYLKHGNPGVRDAAVRSLSYWPDLSAAGELLKLAKTSTNMTHKSLALRGYIRLAAGAGEDKLEMLQEARWIVSTPEEKRLLLAAVSDMADPDALQIAGSLIDDRDVSGEAALATVKIATPIVRRYRPEVARAMEKVLKATKDAELTAQARALLERARAAVDLLSPPPYGRKAIEARMTELERAAGDRRELVCYLDCGVQAESVGVIGPVIKQQNGEPWLWPGSDIAADATFGTVTFDSGQIVFEISNLAPRNKYELGFSWWDYDGNGRTQSVLMAENKPYRFTGLVGPTRLPVYRGRRERPAEMTVPLNIPNRSDGEVAVAFKQEWQSNAVVSEVWLYEVQTGRQDRRNSREILIVTGVDYPGHKWKETAPALAQALRRDPRLSVQVVEKPEFLASPDLHNYDSVVLHFMDWETPAPGKAARENLKKFVEGGKGMMLVHFACGAFQDWPEFEKMAGRVWDPNLRAHDPYGQFTVDIVDRRNPITFAMRSFRITDELYTCLAGDEPIKVLATATSKVDKKVYPMAFTLEYGKGKVFHCVLGHDVGAISNLNAAKLFRRGCAWTAGLPPVPGTARK